MNISADQMKTIASQLTLVTEKLKINDSELNTDTLTDTEIAFRKRIDTVFSGTTMLLSGLITTAPFYYPPLALIAACLLVVTSGLHYYDQKHNYVLSHGIDNLFKKVGKMLKKFFKDIKNNQTLEVNNGQLISNNQVHTKNQKINKLEIIASALNNYHDSKDMKQANVIISSISSTFFSQQAKKKSANKDSIENKSTVNYSR